MPTFSFTKKPVSLLAGQPSAKDLSSLPMAMAAVYQGDTGIVFQSDIPLKAFSVISRYYLVEKENASFHFDIPDHPVVFQANMLGGHIARLPRDGDSLLLQGQFRLSFDPSMSRTEQFKKVGHYHNFYITMPPAFIEKLAGVHKDMDAFLSAVRENRAATLSHLPGELSVEMLAIIGQLTEPQLSPAESEPIFYWQALELLFLAVDQMGSDAGLKAFNRSAGFQQQIEETAAWLLNHLDEYKSIRRLSRKVGINMYKLSQGFKQRYGEGVYEFVTRARLEKSKQLLTCTNLDLQMIAEEIGLPSASFYKIFKEFTNLTPASYRQKYKPEKKSA
jgi:AraC-like DNA-binding protein